MLFIYNWGKTKEGSKKDCGAIYSFCSAGSNTHKWFEKWPWLSGQQKFGNDDLQVILNADPPPQPESMSHRLPFTSYQTWKKIFLWKIKMKSGFPMIIWNGKYHKSGFKIVFSIKDQNLDFLKKKKNYCSVFVVMWKAYCILNYGTLQQVSLIPF